MCIIISPKPTRLCMFWVSRHDNFKHHYGPELKINHIRLLSEENANLPSQFIDC